jgi:tRNA A37 methylthiotransferase MiaB
MSDLKTEVVGAAHESMVGERHEVLVVEPGTGESVKCYDEAYRQVIIRDAPDHGVEPGDFLTVEITGQNTVYAFGQPV